jgi:hypothetical protein
MFEIPAVLPCSWRILVGSVDKFWGLCCLINSRPRLDNHGWVTIMVVDLLLWWCLVHIQILLVEFCHVYRVDWVPSV